MSAAALEWWKKLLIAILAPVSAGLTFALMWAVLKGRLPTTPEWIFFIVVCPFIYGGVYWLAVKITPRK